MSEPFPELRFDLNMDEREARRLVEYAVSTKIAKDFPGRPFEVGTLPRIEGAAAAVMADMRQRGLLRWLAPEARITAKLINQNHATFEWSDGFRTD